MMYRTYKILYKDGKNIEMRCRGIVRWNLFKLRALRNPFFFGEQYVGTGFRTCYFQINTENIFTVEVK